MQCLPDKLKAFTNSSAAIALFFLTVNVVIAQSGRRAPRPSQPATTTSEETTASQKLWERPLKQEVTLIIGKQLTSTHLPSEDAIAASFFNRLGQYTNVHVISAGTLKRQDAVLRARQETNRIVVLIQFDIDRFQRGTIVLNSPDLDVRALALLPQTGAEKFKAKVYYKAVGGPMMKRDNWPNGTPVKITTDAVGIEAAEQIHDWLLLQEIKRGN
ncbi:MAG: hypothetical protein ABR555_13165 [Pyrinomonadaceae bacterium]